jgi:hypothetical protein
LEGKNSDIVPHGSLEKGDQVGFGGVGGERREKGKYALWP